MGLAIISFDAVSSEDIGYLCSLEHFSRLAQRGTLVTEVSSVFLTNTYPAHTSVITGMLPHKHGVVENMFPGVNGKKPAWRCGRSNIKTTTLYDEAGKAGMKTCSILWPVTANAKIHKNLPEVIAEEGKSQVITSLCAGSKWFQIMCLLKNGKTLNGINQPNLDDFALKCALGAGKNKDFDLLLLHLTDVDSHKHIYGPDSAETQKALARMDKRLGLLMNAYAGWDFIVFGDHGCKPITGSVDLNRFWGVPGSFWHDAGGCAFLKEPEGNREETVQRIRALMDNPGAHIKRMISDAEMAESGLGTEFGFGVEAADGYCFAASEYKGNHGYSLAQEQYRVFYLAAGQNVFKNKRTTGGSIMDIAPLGSTMLGLPLWSMDGKLNAEVYDG